MVDLTEVKEVLINLCEDAGVSKGVKDTLTEIKNRLGDEKSANIAIEIDEALRMLENVSSDPNLSADVRTWLWRLTSLLEAAQNNK